MYRDGRGLAERQGLLVGIAGLRYAGHADAALGTPWLKLRISPWAGAFRRPSTCGQVQDLS